ncbi:MAG: hypothetical protein CMI96_02130 [Pelagibacteraceae bacterium]|nr:hypothetical protein [Pelagibacteraceae bacterium]
MKNFGVIRESRPDENRAPLAPKHIEQLIIKFPNLNFLIQPSKNRCFSDDEYKNSGAEINENLNNCSVIFGVKEIDTKFLIKNKTYLFFSHTYKLNKETLNNAQGTPGMDKKELLKSVLEKNIKLIDYENIRDKNSKRYLGFGRFAGIVGCYNTLNLFLEHIKKQPLARAYKINSYKRIISNLKNLYFPKIKILVTGDGRVAKGVIEVLKETNIKEVSKEVFQNEFDHPVFCNLETKDYVTSDKTNTFNLDHFINNPKYYKKNTTQYLEKSDVYISAHYWDPLSPKIFEKNELEKFPSLKIIGDITCDVDGSVPTTIRSSTIENPNFFVNKSTLNETNNKDGSIAVMAVDNLPSELPRDSSNEFGDGIVNEVIPYILKEDDGRILNATIASNGSFLEKYDYLKDYINS